MVTDIVSARRGAARFYWGWLIVASAVSIAANVGDAVFIIQSGPRSGLTVAAALLAVVAPVFQIGATHSISWLVKSRASGAAYKAALVMTAVLGAFAFLLSFVAIRSLALFLGFTQHILGVPVAAIFPLVIDVAISCATVCLLSLTAPGVDLDSVAVSQAATASAGDALVAGASDREYRVSRVTAERVEPSPSAASVATSPRRRAVATPDQHGDGHPRALSAVRYPADDGGAAAEGVDDAALVVIAARIVEARITTKDPGTVAKLLADRVEGYAPTEIAKRNRVHHSVVRKVLDFADPELQAS